MAEHSFILLSLFLSRYPSAFLYVYVFVRMS